MCGPYSQYQGPRGHITCILVSTTREFREYEQNQEKSRYTGKRVPQTKNRRRAPFVARN